MVVVAIGLRIIIDIVAELFEMSPDEMNTWEETMRRNP